MRVQSIVLISFVLVTPTIEPALSTAADWTMFGCDATRNPVSLEKDPPLDWDVGDFDQKTRRSVRAGKNIRWRADLGVGAYASPVISDGMVWIGANSQGLGNRKSEPAAALLRCYRESDGKLLYEYASPRIEGNSHRDPPWQGLSCSPSIRGDRLWFFTNRCETVCLDIAPLRRGEGEPQVVWKTDLKELGIHLTPLWMWPGRICSVSQPFDGQIYLTVPNGVDDFGVDEPVPEAPSLVCLDKDTGKVVWTDNSPGANVLYSEFSSPLVARIGGLGQVVVAQGDGWVRSFDPATGELIWKFDINHKTSKFASGRGKRNYFLATPVLYEERIYIGSGQQANKGKGPGRLVCLDPTKKGDISSELAIGKNGKEIPPRRLQAVDQSKGENAIPNPNSGLMWEFLLDAENRDSMHRTMSSVAIHNGLVIAPDYSGFVHCLDSRTGKKHWTCDCLSNICGSPLIVDEAIYVACNDGFVSLLRLSSDPKVAMNNEEPIAQIEMGDGVFMSPVFANGTLYICDRYRLYAIENNTPKATRPEDQKTGGHWPQWRGPNRDNVSADEGLLKSWPEGGPPIRWRVTGLGDGISPISITGGRVIALSEHEMTEYVHALDERTGEELWMSELGECPYQSRLMRWLTQRPPTIHGELVYAVSLLGELVCLSTTDGRELWRYNYPKSFGGRAGHYGFSDCPIVDGDKLICTPGGPIDSIVALDKRTGRILWRCQVKHGGRDAYSNGVVAEIDGRRQFITFLEKSLVGIDVEDGQLLWRKDGSIDKAFRHPRTPLIHNRFVILVDGFRVGLTVLEIRATNKGISVSEALTALSGRKIFAFYQDNAILQGDYLYEISNYPSGLSCINWRSGKVLLDRKRMLNGPFSLADGHLYVHTTGGRVGLIALSPTKPQVKSMFAVPDHKNSMGTSSPVITGGFLYIREDDQLLCYDVRAGESNRSRPEPKSIKLRIPLQGGPTAAKSRAGPRSIFVPTPHDVVEKMLELAVVKKGDLVYDLGSGDGRIVIAAAKKYRCSAQGFEIDRELIERSIANAEKAGVAKLVTFHRRDIFTLDLAESDVVAMYLLPKQMERLIPQFQKLKPGSRIVSHQFEIPGFKPDKTLTIESEGDGEKHSVHLWIAPLKTPPQAERK